MTAKEIVSKLTLEEKASLCSGKDFWTLKGVERLGLPVIMVTDGPHGLRKQDLASDHLGISNSVPSTCFPTASASACSFDRDLLFRIGQAIGEECLQEKVSVILGPGVNIKRSPLCGRNFEYFSEDPFVSGEMAAALINGIQGKGVGTSLKHYAVNNQEKARFVSNSVVDERALREIYLTAFEIAVKKSQPWTVMCSYNQINGVYGCENQKLLTDILRDEWGFAGLVMTDWGAMNDRVEGVKTGLDLEMPGSHGFNDGKIVAAVKSGALDESALDKVVLRVVELILKSRENLQESYRYDKAAHHALAKKAMLESAVLLKNDDDLLPIKQGQSLAVIGGLAETPRYQGIGSSKINPTFLDSALDSLKAAGVSFDYAKGYSQGSAADPALIEEACQIAANKDHAVIFAGLPDGIESEGFDRDNIDLPESHNQLIQAVAKVNPNVTVVLQLGAPAALPWAQNVKSILLMYAGGQAVNSAAVDLLLGKANPCGKLAETWPLSLRDTPCYRYFPGKSRSVEYRESIFVGYRYYNTAEKPVAYPFGHGLSYTRFAYSNLMLSASSFKHGDKLQVSFTVKNTGNTAGAEIAQLYVAAKNSAVFRPSNELKGFEKVFLQSGESKTVSIDLDTRSFAFYNAQKGSWDIEGGEYEIQVGPSSRDLPLRITLQAAGEKLSQDQKDKYPEYFDLPKNDFAISDASFEALYGRKLPPGSRRPDEPFDLNSTLGEAAATETGKKFAKLILGQASQTLGHGSQEFIIMMEKMLMDLPLRGLFMMSGGAITPPVLDALIDVLNGKPCTDPALAAMLER
uniref:Beta-glucosidase n=1 Tax=uncultured bacterium contig00014 TaxID=1181505 RepID=A0A806KJJ5_9BACT|nr:beta-glucosidase [uncultured bacterium contig00014]